MAGELAKDFFSQGTRRRANPDTLQTTDSTGENKLRIITESPEKIAHTITMRLKDSLSKYSDNLKEY